MTVKSFVSRHVVEASELTLGEFVDEYGTESDLDMDPDTPGYLVYSEDGQEVNWEEADSFLESHLEVGDLDGLQPYQQRLLAERAIVAANFAQLEGAFKKTTFLALPFTDRELLQAQHRAMRSYLKYLNDRIMKFLH